MSRVMAAFPLEVRDTPTSPFWDQIAKIGLLFAPESCHATVTALLQGFARRPADARDADNTDSGVGTGWPVRH